jgi:hypothetical protein
MACCKNKHLQMGKSSCFVYLKYKIYLGEEARFFDWDRVERVI